MKDVINAQMTDEVKAAVRTQIFSVNQTDKGQGHIIIDYPRLLNKGLAALAAEMKTWPGSIRRTIFIRRC
jgi:formate C-acetyltransferase